MAGIRRLSLAALAVLAISTSSVDAFHGRHGTASPTPSYSMGWWSYYYSPPISYYYSCPSGTPVPTIVPVPDARPTPAPPSPTKEPPLGKSDSRLPKITTTRSLGAGIDSSKPTCRVGFWNFAERDVMLTIDGKSWSLPRNQVLTFDVERNFTWQISGQAARVERVPDGHGTYEVLVRE